MKKVAFSLVLILFFGNDAFSQWVLQNPQPSNRDYLDICFVDSSLVFIVGESGIILRSTDSGYSWNKYMHPSTLNLNSVFFINKNNGWAVGRWGLMLKTIDGGLTWENRTLSLSKHFLSICFANELNGIAGMQDGKFCITSDGGTSWIESFIPNASSIIKINYFDSVYVADCGNSYFTSEDYGITWTRHYLSSNIQKTFILNSQTIFLLNLLDFLLALMVEPPGSNVKQAIFIVRTFALLMILSGFVKIIMDLFIKHQMVDLIGNHPLYW